MSDECEMCAQIVGKHRVIERPSESEVAELAKLFWVINSTRLVFCDQECRIKWHALRRKAVWQAHGPTCLCVECGSRT